MRWAVMRMAWSITPAATSSPRTSPAKTGSPAASADVHESGRRALDRRSQTAPEPAVDPDGLKVAAYSSYSTQLSRSIMRAWRSLPPSIGVSAASG